jgi:alcohol dehydrogenase class IV
MEMIFMNIAQYMPVKIIFGSGSLNQLGEIAAQYGKCAMLVTMPWEGVQKPAFIQAKDLLEAAGLRVVTYDKVVPNPTTTTINEASIIAKKEQVDVMIGLGGGSSIDTAKAIAVGATHPGVAWDYVYTEKKTANSSATLPIIAVTTTSGTGSHTTKYAVFTNPDLKVKSTIVNEAVFPKAAIVDPELMRTMPAFVSATTGFDAFTHAFESYTNIHANPLIDQLALVSMEIIVKTLEKAIENPDNLEYRTLLATADTLSGICIANVGTTLPHSIGQPISGKCPWVSHGQSLALVYPEFLKFTQSACIEKFAKVARFFNSALENVSDDIAASELSNEVSELQKRMNIYTSLKELNVPKSMINDIVRDAMLCPDTYVNPRIPSAEQVKQMLDNMWETS